MIRKTFLFIVLLYKVCNSPFLLMQSSNSNGKFFFLIEIFKFFFLDAILFCSLFLCRFCSMVRWLRDLNLVFALAFDSPSTPVDDSCLSSKCKFCIKSTKLLFWEVEDFSFFFFREFLGIAPTPTFPLKLDPESHSIDPRLFV